MATYAELAVIKSDDLWNALETRIKVGAQKKAANILATASPTAPQLAWATSCLANPDSVIVTLSNYIILANSGAAVAVILGADDALIQTHVDAAVDKIAG